jgi:hypothetical protein
MSEIKGWYYLHENKELIYKNSPNAIVDIRDSDLCHSAWAWDGQRQTAWQILVESLSLGADKERVLELAKQWECDDKDAEQYAEFLGIKLGVDGNQKYAAKKDFINIQESPIGFGDTNLEAMAALCKELGFRGGKMWQDTFQDLVKIDSSTHATQAP